MDSIKGSTQVNVTVLNEDRKVELNATQTEQAVDVEVNEIFGTGVKSFTQTKLSEESHGENEVSVVLTNGATFTFKFYNGEKGEQGERGYGISKVQLNDDYTLTVTLENGLHFDTPSIRGEKGERGTGIQSVELRKDYSLLFTLENGKTLETTTILGNELNNIRELEASAKKSADNAKLSEANSNASAKNASVSERNASEFSNSAETYATSSKTSAVNAAKSALVASTSEKAAATSETNSKASAEYATQTKTEIEQLKKETVEQTKTLTDSAKQEISTVKDATVSEVTQLKTDTISDITSIKDRAVEEVTVIKDDAKAEADKAKESETNAKLSETNASNSAKEAKASAESVATVTSDVEKLKEDLPNKITKFYASNQGETHITDSDNGKIQDMMIYGKSSQDGTPSVENPVEIKNVVNPTVKLIGSNILKIEDGEYQYGGVTVTVSNGVLKLKGTANQFIDIEITANSKIVFKEGTKIIFSSNNVKGIENKNDPYLDFTNNNTIGFSIVNNNLNTPYIIKEGDTKYPFILFIRCHEGKNYDETWKPQVLIGETITPFKPYTEQIIVLPITLNAIPVSSNGNVTINGQQYVADYVDVERGKVVQMCERKTLNTKNGRADEEYRLAIQIEPSSHNTGDKECIFSAFKYTSWTTCTNGNFIYIKNIKKSNDELYTAQELKELSLDFEVVYQLAEKQETDLTTEQTQALKELATYYPVTNISVNSEQVEGYTVFNYPISLANGWNYVKKQLNDNRDYIYDMDLQSAEAYVNSEYAVTLTELEV